MSLIVCRLFVFINVELCHRGENMDIVKVFGTNVRRYRKTKGLSQEKLGELSELHRTYISDIE